MRVAIKEKHKRKPIAFSISPLTRISVALLFASAIVPAGSMRWYLQPIQVAYPCMLSQENLLGLPAQSSTEMEKGINQAAGPAPLCEEEQEELSKVTCSRLLV